MLPILLPYHLDEYLPDLEVPIPPNRTITCDLPEGTVWDRMAALYGEVATSVSDAVGRGLLPVVMSGDCTTSLGTVSGMQRAGLPPSIVWFDAHGDLQTLETTASGYLGGVPLRLLVGYRPELISASLALTPVAEDRVVLVDGRDLDPPERDYLAAAPMRHTSVEQVGSVDLPEGPIYLHIDVDVVDPSDLPGLLFPSENGPPIGSVAAAIAQVMRSARVAAVGIGCTWEPHSGAAEQVGRVVDALGSTQTPAASTAGVSSAGEREMLETFLDDYREVIIRKLSGVSESDARRRLVPSLTTLGCVVKHLRWVEVGWFHQLLGSRAGHQRRAHERDSEFRIADDEIVDGLIEDYRAACDTSRSIAAGIPLEQTVPHDEMGEVSLRWIYVHLIEETARHAGHMDILREQIDSGTTPS